MAHIDEVLQIYLLGITDDVLVVKPCSQSLELQLQMAVHGLQKYFSNLSDDHEKFQKIQFIIELLELLAKPEHGRQYSPQLTIFSYMIYTSSSVAYATLRDENILCLPSISTLKKVTRRLNVNNRLNNASYLKLLISLMNFREMLC